MSELWDGGIRKEHAEMGTILILNHLIFSDFDFKSSEIPMILILKRIQNHFMMSYYN